MLEGLVISLLVDALVLGRGAHAFILPDGRKLRFVQQSYSDNYSYYYFLAHISKAYLRLMDAK